MKNIRRDDWENLKPTIYGWGINDVNYAVTKRKGRMVSLSGGITYKETLRCPYYCDWVKMIERSFCHKRQKANPSYADCTMTEEWKYLSNFVRWVDSQPNKDWVDCVPDKDLLSGSQKVYSPETVLYIPQKLNTFILTRESKRGAYMIGVSSCTGGNKINPFQSFCKNPFNGKEEYLGSFSTEIEAHLAWQAKKREHAIYLADEQDDPRAAIALRERYAPDKDWTKQ